MVDVYLSVANTTDWSRQFAPRLSRALELKGLSCHLAQRDANQFNMRLQVQTADMQALQSCKTVVAVADGFTANCGAEIGYVCGMKRRVLILTTGQSKLPLMVEGMATQILKVESFDSIKDYIDSLVSAVKKAM